MSFGSARPHEASCLSVLGALHGAGMFSLLVCFWLDALDGLSRLSACWACVPRTRVYRFNIKL